MFNQGDKVTVLTNKKDPKIVTIGTVESSAPSSSFVTISGLPDVVFCDDGEQYTPAHSSVPKTMYVVHWEPEHDEILERQNLVHDLSGLPRVLKNLSTNQLRAIARTVNRCDEDDELYKDEMDEEPELPKPMEMDGRQNGRVGICELLVSMGFADTLEYAAKLVTNDQAHVYINGKEVSNPTIYPALKLENQIVVQLTGKEPETRNINLTMPYRVVISA